MLFREKWKIFSSGSEPLENYNNDFLLSSQELETHKGDPKIFTNQEENNKIIMQHFTKHTHYDEQEIRMVNQEIQETEARHSTSLKKKQETTKKGNRK